MTGPTSAAGRSMRASAWLVAVCLLAMTVHAGQARAVEVETYADHFTSLSYANNDGTAEWSSDWQETPSNGHASGNIRVVSATRCASGNCLRVGADGLVATDQIEREADLEGAAEAVLTFTYRRQDLKAGLLDGIGDGVNVQVYDGLLWHTVDTYMFNGSDGSDVDASFDITTWANDTTRVRFQAFGVLAKGYLFVDDVQITATFGQVPVLVTDLGNRTDAEGDSVSFDARASDPDGTSITYTASGLPPGTAIAGQTGEISGTISYDAAAGSPYAVTVTATDGDGDVAHDLFTWTVTNTNRPPTIADPGDRTADEGSTVRIDLIGSDPDAGDQLVYGITGAPQGMSVDPSTGTVIWTPSEAQGPADVSFTASVTDAGGASDSVSIGIAIAEVNRPPVLPSLPNRVNGAGDSVAVSIPATDPDVPVDTLTFTASGLPTGLGISQSGRVTGTISGAALSSRVTVTVRDGGTPVLQAQRSFYWTIVTSNNAPRLDPIRRSTTDETGRVGFTARAVDPDGDDVRYSLSSAADPVPPGAAIDAETGVFTWTPNAPDAGRTVRIAVVATDDGLPNLSDTETAVIDVPRLNRAPTIEELDDRIDAEGAIVSLLVAATDPDLPDETLTFSASGLPEGLAIDPSGRISGTVSFEAADHSPYLVRIVVHDGGSPSLTDETTLTWRVTDVNRAPVAADARYAVLAGTSIEFTLTASDPDGDALTYRIEGAPTGGTLDGTAPRLVYTPSAGTTADTVRFVVSDGTLEAAAAVTFDVRTSNFAPEARDDTYVIESSTTSRTAAPGVLSNDTDADGDPLQAALLSAPESGTLLLAPDGSFVYEPEPGLVGVLTFTYEASDGIAAADATVTIRMAPGGDGDDIHGDVVGATPPAPDQPSTGDGIVRTFVVMARLGLDQLPVFGFPLALLLMSLIGAVTIGRISTTPLFGRRIEQTGTVLFYDAEQGFGLIERDTGADVFMDSSVLRGVATLATGAIVRFRAIEGGSRPLATRVSPT